MSKTTKKIILIAQCILNPYCRIHILGKNFKLSNEVLNYLMEKKVGIIQYPCPETTIMGLMRNPQGRQQYDNVFYRDHCEELLKIPMMMVNEFKNNGYKITAFIGVENSPTCGLVWGKHKMNRYGTESPNPVSGMENNQNTVMGIMTGIVSEKFRINGIDVPFLEFPLREQVGAAEIVAFWNELKTAIEY